MSKHWSVCTCCTDVLDYDEPMQIIACSHTNTHLHCVLDVLHLVHGLRFIAELLQDVYVNLK